jgi:hypothetical protein
VVLTPHGYHSFQEFTRETFKKRVESFPQVCKLGKEP